MSTHSTGPVMDRRLFFWASLGFSLSATGLLGCGGGGGAESYRRTRATVTLPPGFTAPLASLAPVARNASPLVGESFEYDAALSGPGLIFLADSQERPLLAGFSGIGRDRIDSQSTALALLYMASAAWRLPQTDQPRALELLAGHAAFGPLVAAVEARLVARPLALVERDTALLAAIDTALDAMGATRAVPPPAAAAPASRHRDVGATALLLTQPSGEQSGIICTSADDLSGLQLVNLRRRHLLYYIRQIAWVDDQDQRHAVDRVVTDGTFPRDWLPSTNRLGGAIGSITDIFTHNGAYQPMKSSIIPLAVLPNTAKQAIYNVTVVGPGGSPGKEPSLGHEPFHTGAVEMFAWEFFKDIFLPFLFAGLDSKLDIDHLANPGAVFQGFKKWVTAVGSGGHVVINTTSGDIEELLLTIFKTIADEPLFRQVILAWLVEFMKAIAPNVASTVTLGFLTRINFYLALIDKVLMLGDTAVAAHDMANANWFEEWEVTAVPIKTRLNPQEATVLNRDIARLTAETTVKGNLVYHWNTTGKWGHLVDAKGHSGTDFDSSDAIVTYGGDKPPATGTDTDTVTVTIYLIPDNATANQRIKVGIATATLTRRAETRLGEVTITLGKAVNTGGAGSFDWTKQIVLGDYKMVQTDGYQNTANPPELGIFVDSHFQMPGDPATSSALKGYYPALAANVTVPILTTGFAPRTGLSMALRLSNNQAVTEVFNVASGTITITRVEGDTVYFVADAQLRPVYYFKGTLDATWTGYLTLPHQ